MIKQILGLWLLVLSFSASVKAFDWGSVYDHYNLHTATIYIDDRGFDVSDVTITSDKKFWISYAVPIDPDSNDDHNTVRIDSVYFDLSSKELSDAGLSPASLEKDLVSTPSASISCLRDLQIPRLCHLQSYHLRQPK